MSMRARPQADAKFVNEVQVADPFEQSRTKFGDLLVQLQSAGMMSATHSAVEAMLDVEGRELLRRMAQDQFRLRAVVEPKRLAVVGSDGTPRKEVVENEVRPLDIIFGEVEVPRLAYRAPRKEVGNLMPLDLELNLPPSLFSFGLQRRAAIEVAKASFESTQETIKDRTGVVIGKKQLEDMVSEMATDFDLFYEIRSKQALAGLAAIFGSPSGRCSPEGLDRSKFLVITTDGKGVAVVEKDLREETRKAAQKRREKHEKTDPVPETKVPKIYRRRTAQVCAVYTVAPFCRKPGDIIREMRHLQPVEPPPSRPKPEAKRVWASVEKDAEPTIRQAFDEALLRDPKRELTWLGVVDGALEQMRIIRRLQKRLGVKPVLILDFIHVAGYVWKASYAFNARGSEAAREWVDERLLAILEGKASDVAAGIRRSATLQHLSKSKRKHVDACCDYILGHVDMMHYDGYLAAGYPIGSGVIEGACRHLLQDRLDLSGATWTVRNAEAVLKLRALRCSEDFDEYWKFHEEQELERNHLSRFRNSKPPPLPATRRSQAPSLRLIP